MGAIVSVTADATDPLKHTVVMSATNPGVIDNMISGAMQAISPDERFVTDYEHQWGSLLIGTAAYVIGGMSGRNNERNGVPPILGLVEMPSVSFAG
jgi:hypothetical protein